jgi:hypothetical protein
MPEQPTPNLGRPREDDRKRERLSVSIAASTNDSLKKWLGRLLPVNQQAHIGRVIDLLVAFAERKKFDPLAPEKKRAGEASPPPPA